MVGASVALPPASSTELDNSPAGQYTTQEKLLLAQAVYKVGAIAWPVVSTLLTEHPLIRDRSRPTELFSAQSCEAAYIALMRSIGQNVPSPDAMKPQAKSHLHLAHTFFFARLTELKENIRVYEEKFTHLMLEISEIKAGNLDASIQKELREILAKRYGKKLLDSWVPPPEQVKDAFERGPPSEEELRVDAEQKDAVTTPGAMVDESTSHTPVEVGEQGDVPTVTETTAADHSIQVDQLHPTESHQIPATPSKPSPAVSELSPPPSVKPDNKSTAPAAPPSPSPVDESAPRASKRKAPNPPKGGPAPKKASRGGRTESTATHSPQPQEIDSVLQPDIAEEMEEDGAGGRGRRQGRRSTGRVATSVQSTSMESPTKTAKDSSPAVSRRAPSVSSTTSAATPAEERRSGRRGRPSSSRTMRDDVAKRNLTESVADDEVKEEEQEVDHGAAEEKADEDEVQESKPSRSTRRGRKTTEPITEEEKMDKKDEKEKPTRGRPKRSSMRTPALADDEERPDEAASTSGATNDALPSAVASSIPGRMSRFARPDTPKDAKAAQKMMYSLLEAVTSHRNGSVFQNPVKKADAPDYYEIIKRPMDLKTIRSKIRDGSISSIDEFERDLLLMFANATMYNGKGSQVYEMAMDMMRESENQIAHFRTMQNDLGR